MKILNLRSVLAMLTLAILFTACTKETSTIEAVQAPDLNALAQEINASPEYKVVQEIRVSIFEELAEFYTENKEAIDADQSVFDNFVSSNASYNNELRDATEQLKAKFSTLNTLTEQEVISVFEIADKGAMADIQLSQSCWDFCHDQYLACDSTCYARYLYFPQFTYHDYLACNGNCVLFVFNTCLDLC